MNLEPANGRIRRHLDLGCGSKPRNPYECDELYGVDIRAIQVSGVREIRKADLLNESIPFIDDFFDSVSAYDFLEHMPRVAISNANTRFPFVELMSEIWRVLRHDGRFYASTPAYPHREAFRDPTHVNILTRDSHIYFVRPQLLAEMYGFRGDFECLRVTPSIANKFEYEPEPPVRFIDKYRFRRRERRGEHSHLVWEFRAIKSG